MRSLTNSSASHWLAVIIAIASLSSGAAIAADANYDRGVAAYKHGDYPQATAFFEQSLQGSPKDLNALYYDALCWHQLKQWPQAAAKYKTILSLYPTSKQAQTAMQFLKAFDPGYIAGLQKDGALAASVPASDNTSASAADSDNDMSDLPDKASFYFTKGPDGHMLVDIMFNGHPMKAIFDTGAGAFFYRDQLQADGIDTSIAKAGGTTHGWAGTAVNVSYMPAEIKLGTLKRKITVWLQDSTSSLTMNLVGQDFVHGYKYSIDDKASRIDLVKTAQQSAQKFDPLYDIPCHKLHGHDYINIDVNGHKVEAFIDTGSDATVLNAETAQAVQLEESGETSHRLGVGGDWTASVGYANIRLGPITKSNFRVIVGGKAGCCVGQDFMEGWRCTVDQEKNLLHFFH